MCIKVEEFNAKQNFANVAKSQRVSYLKMLALTPGNCKALIPIVYPVRIQWLLVDSPLGLVWFQNTSVS